MNDERILDYLRSRGHSRPPANLVASVMAAIDAQPMPRNRFGAFVPAMVAVGVIAVVAGLAVLLGPGRNVGPAPTPAATPTPEVTTLAQLEAAVRTGITRLTQSDAVRGQVLFSVEGYLASATWFDWRPSGDEVAITREDVDVSARWWSEVDGRPLSVGERIETMISVIVDGHYYVARDEGWIAPLERPRGPLTYAGGILSGDVPTTGGIPRGAGVAVTRRHVAGGGSEWILASDDGAAVVEWHIGPDGTLAAYRVEADNGLAGSAQFAGASTVGVIEFAPQADPEPIRTPDLDAAPDPSAYGLPDDFPLARPDGG